MSAARKAPRDPNGRHIRVYCSLLDSPAWRALGWSSRALFVDLRNCVNGTNNGNISATLAELKHRGWGSSATLANALFELQALGFIAKTRGGGVEHGSRVCSLYRFTDLDAFEFPKLAIQHQKATHDYLRLTSVGEAQRALKEAQAKREEDAKGKKTTLQKLNPTASKSEVINSPSASVSEAGVVISLQKLKQRKEA